MLRAWTCCLCVCGVWLRGLGLLVKLVGWEEAEKCEARNIWRLWVEGGGRIYGGDKGIIT